MKQPFVIIAVEHGFLERGSSRREPEVTIDHKRAMLFSDEENAADYARSIVARSPESALRHAEFRAMPFEAGLEVVRAQIQKAAFQQRPVAAGVSSDDVQRLAEFK